eukprot:m.86654 g.86654  ORF g.86654 m.86654 type:complete len:322 (+) comp15102_c0_seq8:220-1185(+)
MAHSMQRTLKESISASAADPILRTVIKATDSEMNLPKRKHLEALLSFTHRQDVSMTEVIDGLFNRLEEGTWVVCMKMLYTIHRLLRDGHERFASALATRTALFSLHDFDDRKTPNGLIMSSFVRNYSSYLSEKVANIRLLGYDVCHVKGARQAVEFKSVAPPALFRNMESIQSLVECLLLNMRDIKDTRREEQFEVQVIAGDYRRNPLIQGAVQLLFQDTLRIFVCLNDGIVNILERYFKMQKKDAVDAFKIYDRFIEECKNMTSFFDYCKSVGVTDGRNIPDLLQAPTKLRPTLKDYIDNYGTKKGADGELDVKNAIQSS